MSSLNKCMVIGNLGQDPEIRQTQRGTSVATLSIATTERYKDSQGQQQEKTEWHRCVAWGRTAEICRDYLSKGGKVYIEGPIQTRKWEDKEGVERYTTEIKVLNLVMLDSGKNNNGKELGQKNQPQATGNFDDSDDILPF